MIGSEMLLNASSVTMFVYDLCSETRLWASVTFTLFMVIVTILCERAIAHHRAGEKSLPPSIIIKLSWGRGLGKSAASMGFLAYFYFVTQGFKVEQHHVVTGAIWLGLLSSALGDILLLGHRDRDFLAGLVSFFLAHIAYAYAFISPLSDRLLDPEFAIVIVSFTTVAVAISLVIYHHLKPDIQSDMRVPALAYTLVISIMVAAAAIHTAYLGHVIITLGAVAFWFSDLAVARQQFQGDRLPYQGLYVRYWGLPLYYLSQLMISSGGVVS